LLGHFGGAREAALDIGRSDIGIADRAFNGYNVSPDVLVLPKTESSDPLVVPVSAAVLMACNRYDRGYDAGPAVFGE
jgi:hypothetical protein